MVTEVSRRVVWKTGDLEHLEHVVDVLCCGCVVFVRIEIKCRREKRNRKGCLRGEQLDI
jgi:hypothetical protein